MWSFARIDRTERFKPGWAEIAQKELCAHGQWPEVCQEPDCIGARELAKNDAEWEQNQRYVKHGKALADAASHAAMEWRLHGALTDSCRALEAAIALVRGEETNA